MGHLRTPVKRVSRVHIDADLRPAVLGDIVRAGHDCVWHVEGQFVTICVQSRLVLVRILCGWKVLGTDNVGGIGAVGTTR